MDKLKSSLASNALSKLPGWREKEATPLTAMVSNGNSTECPSLLELEFPNRTENWLISDRLKNHVCGNMNFFSEMTRISETDRTPVSLDKKSPVYPIGKGTVVLEAKMNGNWTTLSLRDVLYIPSSTNLLSFPILEAASYYVDLPKCRLKNLVDPNKSISFWQDCGNLYVDFRPVYHSDLAGVKFENIFNSNDSGLLYHLRFFHVQKEILSPAIDLDLVKCDTKDTIHFVCNWCLNTTTNITKKLTNVEKIEPGSLIFAYFLNQTTASISKNNFCVLLQDKSTNYMWTISAKNKQDAGEKLKLFFKNFKRTHKTKVHVLKFVNAINIEILEVIQAAARKKKVLVLAHQFEAPDADNITCAFNFVIDKLIETLALTGLPLALWDLVLYAIVYTQNVLPCPDAILSSPFERLKHKKPSTDHFRILGSPAIPYVSDKGPKREYLLAGYSSNESYILYNFQSGKVITTDKVFFNEEKLLLKYTINPSSKDAQYTPTAPPANFLDESNTPIETLHEEDLKFIFEKLKNADLNNKESLSFILKSFKKHLQTFQDQVVKAVPFSNTTFLPRSNSLDGYNLSAKFEFEPLVTRGNGQCLYNAISLALFGSEKYYASIRLLLLHHVIENWDVLTENSIHIFGGYLGFVINKIVDETYWGEDSHIFLLSEILQRPIFLVQMYDELKVGNNIYQSNPSTSQRNPVYILLLNNHFEALAPKPNTIITTVTKQNSQNLYSNTQHKYVFNFDADVNFVELETVTALYPSLKDEWSCLDRLTPKVEKSDHSKRAQSSKTKTIREEDLKVVFERLNGSAKKTKQFFNDILEPFEKRLNVYEEDARSAIIYSNLSQHPRSSSLEGYELLAKQELEPLETYMDGQCFYHSISLALFSNQTDFLIIRLLILRHIIQHWDILKQNCKKIFDLTFEDLVKTTIQVHCWGKESHLFLLSEILSRPIFSLTINQSLQVKNRYFNSNPVNSTRPAIYLFLQDGHYEPLIPKPTKIITSITEANAMNFYINTDHKYIYNGNLNVHCYFDIEKATKLFSNVTQEIVAANNVTPDVYDLTDNDDDSAEKVYCCVNCKAKNERLKEVYATNADLKRQIRAMLSLKLHQDKLPIMSCDNCTEIASRAKLLEAQTNQLRDRHNRHGELLIQQVNNLKTKVKQFQDQNKDLLDGKSILHAQLAKRNQEKLTLEKELIVLAAKLESIRDFDAYHEAIAHDWTRDPSQLSPIMTPGRNIPTVGNDMSHRSTGNSATTRPTSSSRRNSHENVLSDRSSSKIQSINNSPNGRAESTASPTSANNNNQSHSSGRKSKSPGQNVLSTEKSQDVWQLVKNANLQQTDSQNNSNTVVDLARDLSLSPSTIGSEQQQDNRSNRSQSADQSHTSARRSLSPGQNVLSKQESQDLWQLIENAEFQHNDELDISHSVADLARDSIIGSQTAETGSFRNNINLAEDETDTELDPNDFDTNCRQPSDDDSTTDMDDDDNPPASGASKKVAATNKMHKGPPRVNMQDFSIIGDSSDTQGSRQNSSHCRDQHQCIFCSLKFASRRLYFSHLKAFHKVNTINATQNCVPKKHKKHGIPSKKVDPQCVFCESKFLSEDAYHYHLLSYHNIDGYQETHCTNFPDTRRANPARRIRPESNLSHQNEHEEACSYEPIASTSSDTRPGFTMHNHNNGNTFEVKIGENEAPRRKVGKGLASSNDNGLGAVKPTKQKQRKHAPEKSSNKEKPFKCNSCEKRFTAKSSLKRHMDTHTEGGFPCRFCPIACTTHEGLMVHSKRNHGEDRTQKCRFCDKIFKKSKKVLKSHEMTKHFNKWFDAEKAALSSSDSE